MRMSYLCLTDEDAARVRAAQPAEGELVGAAWQLAALADPTRLRVAFVLATSGELCVGDTATLLDSRSSWCRTMFVRLPSVAWQPRSATAS